MTRPSLSACHARYGEVTTVRLVDGERAPIRWIDRDADPRPLAWAARATRINGESVETLAAVPVAGVGVDGNYHPGLLLRPAIVDRAQRLTDNRELRLAGVRTARIGGPR